MPTMTKTSCQVLYLSLWLVGWAFGISSSPTARANMKKAESASISVPRKVIGLALIDLYLDKRTINDKWLTLKAICELNHCSFDFSDGIDFTSGELKKAPGSICVRKPGRHASQHLSFF
jgi:hypothetical protein